MPLKKDTEEEPKAKSAKPKAPRKQANPKKRAPAAGKRKVAQSSSSSASTSVEEEDEEEEAGDEESEEGVFEDTPGAYNPPAKGPARPPKRVAGLARPPAPAQQPEGEPRPPALAGAGVSDIKSLIDDIPL